MKKLKEKASPPLSDEHAKVALELVAKRNMQFTAMFRKMRDPYTILKAFLAIQKIFARHFGKTIRRPDEWLKILMWVYDKEHRFFYFSDLKDELNLTQRQIGNVLKAMGIRHLLHVDNSRRILLYTLTPEAHLLLQNFSRDCISAVMEIVRDGRKGRLRKQKFISPIEKRKK